MGELRNQHDPSDGNCGGLASWTNRGAPRQIILLPFTRMSYDRYEIEYHLTPTGWVAGTDSDMGSAQKAAEPPDRVC